MRESTVETILGVVVVAAAAIFLWFGLSASGSSGSGERYEVAAPFNNVSGIDRGSDVRVAGMKKGIVKSITYDPQRFEAKLVLALDEDLELPIDSDARIVTDGLLGGAYVAIEPGGDFDNIPTDGTGEILYTRGAVDLLTLFASFATGGDDGAGDSDAGMPEADYPPVPGADKGSDAEVDNAYPDAPGAGDE